MTSVGKIYGRFRAEILLLAGAGLPFLLRWLAGASDDGVFSSHLETFAPWYFSGAFAIYAAYALWRYRSLPLRFYRKGGDPDFRTVLDSASRRYWYLGMGAEEFLRDIQIESYFSDRALNGNRIEELRILLLDPESEPFNDRLAEVHPQSEVARVAELKRAYLQTLLAGLSALSPEEVGRWEVRFYQEVPIWLLQFVDSKPELKATDRCIVSFHLQGRHSRDSRQLVCDDSNPDCFDAFLKYFESQWATATRVKYPVMPKEPRLPKGRH